MSDPLTHLIALLHRMDPIRLKSPVQSEYEYEAKELMKELPFITTKDRLKIVLFRVFATMFTKKDASNVDWEPIASAIISDPVVGKVCKVKPSK